MIPYYDFWPPPLTNEMLTAALCVKLETPPHMTLRQLNLLIEAARLLRIPEGLPAPELADKILLAWPEG